MVESMTYKAVKQINTRHYLIIIIIIIIVVFFAHFNIKRYDQMQITLE